MGRCPFKNPYPHYRSNSSLKRDFEEIVTEASEAISRNTILKNFQNFPKNLLKKFHENSQKFHKNSKKFTKISRKFHREVIERFHSNQL